LNIAAQVRNNPGYSSRWYPIVFPEESYEICSVGQFWLEALLILVNQTRDHRLETVFQEIKKEVKEQVLSEKAFEALMAFADDNSLSILLIVENLPMLFGQQISPKNAWELHDTLVKETRIMLIGTGNTPIANMNKADNPWYGLFKIHELEPFDIDQWLILWEKKTGRTGEIDQLRPIHILTGGNPRLLVKLAQFAGKTSSFSIQKSLLQLIDSHTEYYKNQIDLLPALERKVLVTLADIWNPATARDIAAAARIDVNKASAYLQRLLSKGILVVVHQQGRKQWYQIRERMFNIYHLVRRFGKSASRVWAVVDFMVHFYNGRGQQPEEDFHNLILQTIPFRGIGIQDFFPSFFDHGSYVTSSDGSIDKHAMELQILEKIESIIGADPENASAWSRLGTFLMTDAQRLEDAENVFIKALELDPDEYTAWFNTGVLLMDQYNRFNDAENAFRQAVRIDPENPDPWFNLGLLLTSKPERYHDAFNAYKNASELDPDDYGAWNNLGVLLCSDSKRFKEAENALKNATLLRPGDSMAWCNLGFLLSSDPGRFKDAQKAYKKVIELDSDAAGAWIGLALLLRSDSRLARECEKALKTSVDLKPDIYRLQILLIECSLTQGKLKQALKIAQSLLTVSGLTAETYDALARCFYQKGDRSTLELAQEWSRNAADMEEENPDYRFTLAVILGTMGRWDESLETVQQIAGDNLFVNTRIKEITDYYIDAAVEGYAEGAVKVLEQFPGVDVMEPVLAGLNLASGNEYRTAREILEIGRDVAERIRQRA